MPTISPQQEEIASLTSNLIVGLSEITKGGGVPDSAMEQT